MMKYFQRGLGGGKETKKGWPSKDSGGGLAISGPEGAGRGGDISAHRATALREAA